MSKVLYVGDPHVRVEDLEDCQVLLDKVFEIAHDKEVDRTVFLGDEHHTMAVVRVEVMEFWYRNLEKFFQNKMTTVLLTGNHDQSGDASSKAHALVGYKGLTEVVDEPHVIEGILHVPHIHSNQEFIDICNEYSHCKTAVAHQDFYGAQYENSFYSTTGVDQTSIPQNLVLSGHIHHIQRSGKVDYLGSPRWLTASDANDDRFLTLITHAPDGSEIARELIPSPCQRIWQVEDKPDSSWRGALIPGDKYIVDIVGPQAWIEERRPLWLGKARIRTRRTDQQIIRLKESEGIEKALVTFAKGFIPPHGTPNDVLMSMVKTRLLESA